MGGGVPVIESNGLARRLGECRMRFGGSIPPTEHALEMSSQREIAVSDRIGRVERDGLVQQTPRLGQVILGEAPDAPLA